MQVEFSLNMKNELTLEYSGTATKRTVVNMTNHTYWNMSGNLKRNLYKQLLQVNAPVYLPVVDMVRYTMIFLFLDSYR